jgi:hypothetical protein
MKKNSPPINPLDTEPTVILTALHSGEVVYQAVVGAGPLAHLLSDLSKIADSPLVTQEYQIDTVGQEILHTSDKSFFLSIVGSFSALPWAVSKSYPQIFTSEGLTFAFVISY